MISKWFEWIKNLLSIFAPSQAIEVSHIKLNEEYKKLNDFYKKSIEACDADKIKLEKREEELLLRLNKIRDEILKCEEDKYRLKVEVYKLKNKKEEQENNEN